MELIIGMTIAFLLGAYIRQPFALRQKVVAPVKTEKIIAREEKIEKELLSLQDQFANIMKFTGKDQGETK